MVNLTSRVWEFLFLNIFTKMGTPCLLNFCQPDSQTNKIKTSACYSFLVLISTYFYMQLREPVKLLSREGRTLLISVRAGVSGGGLEAGRPDVKYWGVNRLWRWDWHFRVVKIQLKTSGWNIRTVWTDVVMTKKDQTESFMLSFKKELTKRGRYAWQIWVHLASCMEGRGNLTLMLMNE